MAVCKYKDSVQQGWITLGTWRKVMYLFQTVEVLYKLDRRMSTAVLGHLYGGNKSTISFMKK